MTPQTRLWHNAPAFTGLALFITLTAIPLIAAATLDARQFLNTPVWHKPLQFHLALSIYLITLAFFARYLPQGLTTRNWRAYSALVTFCTLTELAWVAFAAANNTASHFATTPILALIYPVMGLFAVILTSPSLAIGITIARNPNTGLPPALHLAISLGLILTFILTLIAAGTLSSQTGHLVGHPITDASLPILGWSREVGDLRVAHFFATHALHAIPLVGLAAARLLPKTQAKTAVWAAAAAYSALVALTMIQAFQGHPFLPFV